RPGLLVDLSGTASALVACTDRFAPDVEQQWLRCIPSALPGLWHLNHTLFGGQAVRWFAEQFPPSGDPSLDLNARLAAWDARAAAHDSGPSRLIFLPHLGGRWYPPHPAATGGWLGLTWGAQAEDLYRAMLASVAFEFSL